MGANSRRRREARQRRTVDEPQGRRRRTDDPGYDGPAAYAIVELAVLSTIRRLGRGRIDATVLRDTAQSLRHRIRPHPAHVLEAALAETLDRMLTELEGGGWGAADLDQLVHRCAGQRGAALVTERAGRRLDTIEAQAAALQVIALLSRAPRLETDALLDAASNDDGAVHPKLARVRALLAKAESTEYDEEAEALSAKAQELITKYALDRLVAPEPGGSPRSALGVRRLWLDPPYVSAKACLVHEVAQANRCRAAATDGLGFCLLIGAPSDIDAVELLVTSLLLQAGTAMLRHGRRDDRLGPSRTRSFRRSFLLAYAGRIGERLRAATEAATAEAGRDLLPVVRDHGQRVDAAFRAALPGTVERRTTFSNWDGWAAGVAAADLASLDVHAEVRERRSDHG